MRPITSLTVCAMIQLTLDLSFMPGRNQANPINNTPPSPRPRYCRFLFEVTPLGLTLGPTLHVNKIAAKRIQRFGRGFCQTVA